MHLEFYDEAVLSALMADTEFMAAAAHRKFILSERSLSLLEPVDQNTEQMARALVLTLVRDHVNRVLRDLISATDFVFNTAVQHDLVVGQMRGQPLRWFGICRVIEVTTE